MLPLHRRLVPSLLVALLGSACSSSSPPLVEESGEETPSLSEIEKDRAARQAAKAEIVISASETVELGLHPAQVAGAVVLHDCTLALGVSPGVPLFGATNASGRYESACAPDSIVQEATWDGVPKFNLAANDCNHAMCKAQVTLCASHRLLELAGLGQWVDHELFV